MWLYEKNDFRNCVAANGFSWFNNYSMLCGTLPVGYNGITGILGSLLGLDLIIPLIICIIFFICGAVVCFKAIGEK